MIHHFFREDSAGGENQNEEKQQENSAFSDLEHRSEKLLKDFQRMRAQRTEFCPRYFKLILVAALMSTDSLGIANENVSIQAKLSLFFTQATVGVL